VGPCQKELKKRVSGAEVLSVVFSINWWSGMVGCGLWAVAGGGVVW
jgi:hypothetical protein